MGGLDAAAVGEAVLCTRDQMEGTGDLLEVRWMFLDAQEGWEKAREEDWVVG